MADFIKNNSDLIKSIIVLVAADVDRSVNVVPAPMHVVVGIKAAVGF